MFGLFLMLLVLDGLLLSVIVLLQAGKGDGLAAMGASGGTIADGVMGGRQAATFLTRMTWICGGLFLFLALLLSVMSSRQQTSDSMLQQEFTQQSLPQPLVPEGAPPAGVTTPPPATSTGQGATGQTTTTNQ
ncbi:MAG: preprotein translocase subunit SecG [Longimicrobiales bacterium]